MDWWSEVRVALGDFLDKHGLLAAFVFLLIEEAGLPIPVPGDFLMLVLGVKAREGTVSLWQAILAMEAATVIGATFLYAISRWAGHELVYRYGRFIRLTPERLDRAEAWIQRHGWWAVFLGRLLPGLRIVTAVACGVFEVSVWVFVPAMSAGALVYILLYTLLGYFVGPPILRFLERLQLPLGVVVSLLLLAGFVVWVLRARHALGERINTTLDHPHRQRFRAGAAAGLLATVGSTAAMDLLVNLAGNLAFQAPGTIVENTASRLARGVAVELGPILLFVAVPAYLGVGVVWGAVYGGWAEQALRVPDWASGLVFAGLPLLTSLVVVMPALGLGFLGVGGTGPVAAVGELLRHAAFGVLLGLTYPVLLVRRRQIMQTGEPEAPDTPDQRPSVLPTAAGVD